MKSAAVFVGAVLRFLLGLFILLLVVNTWVSVVEAIHYETSKTWMR